MDISLDRSQFHYQNAHLQMVVNEYGNLRKPVADTKQTIAILCDFNVLLLQFSVPVPGHKF